jgi:branched-chain amino acid transport system substrate-binding protein
LLSGLKAAVSIINAKGGIMGRKIDITVQNDASNPTQAVSLVQGAIGSNMPNIVFGGTSSGEILPVSQVTNPAKIFTISVGADTELGEPSKFPYTFAADATQESQGASIIQYLKSKGYTNIGLITSNDATGTSYAAIYQGLIRQAGLKLVDAETYDTSAVDMSAQFGRLKSANPDAIIMEGSTFGAYLAKSRYEAGAQNIPTIADATVQSVDWVSAVPAADTQGLVMQVYKANVSTTNSPGKTALLNALKEQGVTPALPLEVYALSSDLLLSYANAALTVNSIDPSKIRAALEGNNYQKTFPTLITTDYGWTSTEHLSNGVNDFAFIPPTPIKNGQYQVS